MNYKKIYNSIIDNRKNNHPEGYSEKHHILPKSLGGIDEETNIVRLTPREHFICHCLLSKMFEYDSFEWHKMNRAFMMMKCKNNLHREKYFNSRLYDNAKKHFSHVMSKHQSGKNNSNYGSIWIINITTGETKKITKNSIIDDGWKKGRIIKKTTTCSLCCEDTKMSMAKYCNGCRKKIQSNNATNRNNDPEFKKKVQSKLIGHTYQSGSKNSQFGSKWMIKDGIRKKVKKEEIIQHSSDGWL